MKSTIATAVLLMTGAMGANPALAQTYPVGFGPNPVLPKPEKSLIPTVNVAPVDRWTAEETPRPIAGFAVTAYARGLDHPRWLYTLPNGDVLVAETNAPPKPDDSKGGELVSATSTSPLGSVYSQRGWSRPRA